ncbi:MAG: MFS transporter [Chlamydiales bacterium]|nr:MFS transporter [Chlamydiales bacterium]
MSKPKPLIAISLFVLCFGAFLNWMSYGLVYPIFASSIFHQDAIFLGSASNALRGLLLGILLAACPLAQFFSSPFIGGLSDRKGRKPVMQMTTLLIVVGALLSVLGVWQRSFSLLILGRIATGIGAGNIAVINSSIADFSSKTVKTKNFALVAMANGIGFAVGPFVGGKLSSSGFEIPFIFAGFLTVANYILITLFFSETLVEKKRSAVRFAAQLHHLWKTTLSPKFRIIFSVFFIFCFGWSFYWEFIPVTWIKNYGLNVSQIGNFYAFGSLVYVVSSGVLIRPILNRFKASTILFGSLGALGFFLLLLIGAKIESYWVNIGIQQFLIALIFPIGTAIVSDLTSPDQQGETLGVFQSLQAFAFAITPFLGGGLLNLSYGIPLILGGVSMLLACLILLVGLSRKFF